MAWVAVFGVNGAGKSTIAKEMKKLRSDIQIISGTNVLLKALGEDIDMSAEQKIPLESYQLLASLDSKTLEHAYTAVLPQVLETYKRKHDKVVFFYHLCVVNRDPLTGNSIYDNSFVRDWYFHLFEHFILLDVSAREIQARCQQDRVSKNRVRTELSLEEIETQISKSTQEWNKLVRSGKKLGKNSCSVLSNEEARPGALSYILNLV